MVTEGHRGLLPEGGYVVDAGDDWGYVDKPHHRKVLLRSRWPLSDVDWLTTGGGAGRVVTALTAASAGPVRILAICIPWARAHVSTRRRDATAWSEHLGGLDQLEVLGSTGGADGGCQRLQSACPAGPATREGRRADG
ncbi:conserved hypothetical protein [Rhodococcus sp. RD6.2]|uniref:hypothetical protein n=1 Tax=Rhodococcus sp. RD6.2 TaxID=260936 RepID=UPI00063B2C67|nr:hypothetical protein [Rhodococcus sp. RD6.2]CRK52149.1 conserved hypothetical protein [Rhodococcus sp. RD6.2]